MRVGHSTELNPIKEADNEKRSFDLHDMLRHGKGLYLLTDMETHNAGEVTANAPMHENILHFIIKWREEHLLSVELLGRMIAPWGKIRSEKGL